jgi:organic radical activating enzyme
MGMRAIKFYGIGFNEPQDFIVSWNLGNSCNWKCDYCPSYLNDGSVYWIDNDTIKRVLLQIKKHFPDRQIRLEFTGGEVTTKPDFVDLMKFCKEEGFKNHINTNASRTVSYWERLAPYLFSANCAFHPLNADKEHYENIVDTMILHGCHPVISLAMVKDVFWDMVEYKKYLEEKYRNRAYVDIIMLYDKEQKKAFNGYFYDYDQDQKDYLKFHIGKNYVVEYDDGTHRQLSTAEIQDEKLYDFSGFLCGSKLNMISIDYHGGASISVCNQRRPININSENFDEMLAPKICMSTECRNPSDLRILKVRPEA